MNQARIQLGHLNCLLLQPTQQDKKITIVLYHDFDD